MPPSKPASQPSSSFIPPFATKEPERYQARRTTTFIESTGGSSLAEATRTITVRIVRDGDQRREEYESGSPGSVVYLESLASRFVLLPQEKLYADLSGGFPDSRLNQLQTDSGSTSSNSLLHENNVSPRYEKLGSETLDGRLTMKYRVSASTNSATGSERVIWVDEVLGMPVKSELVHNEGPRSSRVLMQLNDIRTEVDLTQFEIPADYRKVEASHILDLIANYTGIRKEKPQK